jgi:hypothetical protein
MTKKSYPSQIIWNSTIKTRGISERQHWFYCKKTVGKLTFTADALYILKIE